MHNNGGNLSHYLRVSKHLFNRVLEVRIAAHFWSHDLLTVMIVWTAQFFYGNPLNTKAGSCLQLNSDYPN